MVKCGNSECGAVLNEAPSTPIESRAGCPKCGSLSRLVTLEIATTATVYLALKAKARHGQPGQVRPFLILKSITEIFRKTGERTHREKIEDRDNDRYRERVVSLESGKVLHECDEPLSEHRGHGSAKKTKSD
jgi:hypothetical protein